jgi:hypothetical protein
MILKTLSALLVSAFLVGCSDSKNAAEDILNIHNDAVIKLLTVTKQHSKMLSLKSLVELKDYDITALCHKPTELKINGNTAVAITEVLLAGEHAVRSASLGTSRIVKAHWDLSKETPVITKLFVELGEHFNCPEESNT